MPQPTNRLDFKEWCLRKLGKPVIDINISDDQAEDRIDEALSYYWDYHFDGTEKTYFKYQLTATDIANGYITIPESIIGVVNIFDISSYLTASGMFNAKYQFMLNNITDIASYSMLNYVMTRQHIELMEDILSGQSPMRYNRHMNRLYIDMDWKKVVEGQYVVAECYNIVDPNIYVDVWKDRWLQNYATAKMKYQWGSNLTKFENMQLPGGVMFNGQQILSDARDEIMQLEDEMISSYSLPVHNMIG
jgi:hypothetical protein